MATEEHGTHDYYFVGQGNLVRVPYTVTVKTAGKGPAEEAKTSEARLFHSTLPQCSTAEADKTFQLKKTGQANFDLDLASFKPAEHSPLFVQFYFEKDFKSGPKAGTTEINDRQGVGVVLAEPEVGAIGIGLGKGKKPVPQADAKPGEAVTLEILEWGALMYQVPARPPVFQGGIDPKGKDKARIPSAAEGEVKWTAGATELGAGATATFNVPADAAGKTFDVVAHRTDLLQKAERAAAKVVVPKLEIVGAKGPAAKKVALSDADGEEFQAKLTPADLAGEFSWTIEGGKASIGKGAKVAGPKVTVKGTEPSAADDDQTLKLTWTSKVTGKVHEVTHKLTVSAWPAEVKGVLFYKRTWNYKDATAVAVEEVLPGSRVELWTQAKGAAALAKQQAGKLTEEGAFEFKNIPECTKMAVRIFLEHSDGATVKLIGESNAIAEADLEVKKDAVVWGQVELDLTEVKKKGKVDLKKVELKKDKFVALCDLYKSLWFGERQMKKLTSATGGLCLVHVPSDPASTSYHSNGELWILESDYKDRGVVLHEYGHFIDRKIGPQVPSRGYEFDDDARKSHGETTEEHYESAFKEGFATFMACVLQDDPTYYDGEPGGSLTMKLDKSPATTVGPHAEGSIQGAFWHLFKTQGVPFSDMWKAFTDTSKRKCYTVFSFYQNFKDLGLPKKDKLVESWKKYGMEYCYSYDEEWECADALDAATKKFKTLDELYDQLGKTGSGTLADYKKEFYNRNKYVEPKHPLAAGSTKTDPKVEKGKKYVAPKREQVS
jgi:hypothetical protein